MKRTAIAAVIALGVASFSHVLVVKDASAAGRGQERFGVYVESQGMIYYSILAAERLPAKGRFQKLDPTGGPGGMPSTEFGPGDHGYVGGRWWVDAYPEGGNGIMDEEDVYFSCPLLGPGHPPG